MSANLSIIKRDGSKAEFDKLKIENAILKAMKYGIGVLEEDIAKNIADEIEKIYLQGSPSPTVSKVEELVYKELIDHKQELTAKAYEGYRAVQSFKREVNTTDDSIIGLLDRSNEDVLNEKCPSDTPYIEFNGNILGFDVPPIIEDGSTLVPMRFLFEQMGADVEWDSETQTATATLDNKAVTFSIDNVNARINNKSAKMDVPARLVNGKTMVPLRFLSENMGYDVDWDADSRTAIIKDI